MRKILFLILFLFSFLNFNFVLSEDSITSDFDCSEFDCDAFTWLEFLKDILLDLELDSANNLALKWIINDNSLNPELYNLDSVALRQEIALVSRRVSWIEEKEACNNVFSDISLTSPNDWACKNIEALVENDLISRNESFRPEDNISKSEALIMFVKAIWFKDFKIDNDSEKNWQEQVVEFSVNIWIVEHFTDYNEKAKRWWIFQIADFAINIKEERTEKWTWN